MQASKLPPIFNLNAMLTRVYRSLLYPTPALSLTNTQYRDLSNKLTSPSLPKCGIVRSFPTKWRYLPRGFQGLGLPNLYLEQNVGKIRELLNHSYTDSLLWKQLQVGLEFMQLEAGVSELILNVSYKQYSPFVLPSWLKALWQFMDANQFQMKGWKNRLEPARRNDMLIMHALSRQGYSMETMSILNKCRIYLQVFTLADISTASGQRIIPSYLSGRRDPHRPSRFAWRTVHRPTPTAFLTWRRCILETFCGSTTTTVLRFPLGSWICGSTISYQWFANDDETCLYHLVDNLVRVYHLESPDTRYTRSTGRWYRARSTLSQHAFDPSRYRLATISATRRGTLLVSCDSTSPPPPPSHSSPNTNLFEQLSSMGYPHWFINQQPTTLTNHNRETLLPFFQGITTVVSDASFAEGRGASAAIFETHDLSQSSIFISPVPSNNPNTPHSNDPYRSEFVGVWSILTIIKAAEELTSEKGTFHIYCDNDAVIQKMRYSYDISTSFKHHDIARAALHLRDSIESKLIFSEVVGHADDKITSRPLYRQEQLNLHCDELAKEAIHLLDHPSPAFNLFPTESMTIWHRDTKLYSNMDARIRLIYHTSQAKQSFSKKYETHPNVFDSIDWNAVRAASSIMTPSTNTYISKHVLGFLPIGRNMLRRTHWRESYCPRCHFPDESTSHLLQCPHVTSHEVFRKSLDQLNKWFIQSNTDPTLSSQLLEIFSSYKFGGPILPNPNYITPIQSQLSIGWTHLMQGRPHQDFRLHMEQYYRSINSRRKAATWIKLFIQKIWTLVHAPQWTSRNRFVHNLDKQVKSTRARQNLLFQLKEKYTQEHRSNLLHKDQHLLSRPLHILKTLPNSQIQAWIYNFDAAISERDKIFSLTDTQQSASLRTFLLPPPRIITNPCPIPRPTVPPRLSVSVRLSTKNPQKRKRRRTSTPRDPTTSRPPVPPTTTHPPTEPLSTIPSRLFRPSRKRKMSSKHPTYNQSITNDTSGTHPTYLQHKRKKTYSLQQTKISDLWSQGGTKRDLLTGSWLQP